MKIDPHIFPCIKLKSKCVNNLNINSVTLNLIEEKVGSSLESMDTGTESNNKWYLLKPRSLYMTYGKNMVNKTKGQSTE